MGIELKNRHVLKHCGSCIAPSNGSDKVNRRDRCVTRKGANSERSKPPDRGGAGRRTG